MNCISDGIIRLARRPFMTWEVMDCICLVLDTAREGNGRCVGAVQGFSVLSHSLVLLFPLLDLPSRSGMRLLADWRSIFIGN